MFDPPSPQPDSAGTDTDLDDFETGRTVLSLLIRDVDDDEDIDD